MRINCGSCIDNQDIINDLLINKRGFITEKDPITQLSHHYVHWENTAGILPEVISQVFDNNSFNKKLNYFYARRLLEEMPKYEVDNLRTENERRRAILLLGIFAHAWVWLPYVSGVSDKPEHFIPEQISVPLYQLTKSFNRPPVLTNSDLFDYNWTPKNSGEEMNIHNLDILNGFVKNDAEKYFYLTYFIMNLKGSPAIQAMLKLQNTLENTIFISESLLTEMQIYLDIITQSLEEIRKALSQVFSNINKEDWFNKVRCFSVGWNNKDMFPNGVIYEGVKDYNNQGQFFYGPSGFQYPVFHCVDAFLDIQHQAYIQQVNSRLYMPYSQVTIINSIENKPKIRTLLTEQKIGNKKVFIDTNSAKYKDVIEAYNNCIRKVKNIRSLHFGVVSKYLTKMLVEELDKKLILTTGGQQDNHEHLLKGIIDDHNIQIT